MDAQSHLQVEVEQLVRIHGRNRTALMPVLQELNRAHSYISEDAMLCVAKELNVPRAEVYGVATFYSFLSVKPRGKFVVRMCRTISCAKQGNFHPVLEDALSRHFERIIFVNIIVRGGDQEVAMGLRSAA